MGIHRTTFLLDVRGYEINGVTAVELPGIDQVALVEPFPMEQVYNDLDGRAADLPQVDLAGEALRRVFSWVYQPPCSDTEGFYIRSVIACWVFTPQLRSYSLTQIARRHGKVKQSLGRWVDDFKGEFPELTAHLHHLRNHGRKPAAGHRRAHARATGMDRKGSAIRRR